MNGPYINTELHTTVSLMPNQMDNAIYINLKENLKRQVAKKCLKNYGYIVEVYEITEYKGGIIEAENFLASSKFDISFSCRLCKPLKMKQIICKIERINKLMLVAVNGPILVIITNDRINDKTFFLDNNNNIRYKKDNISQQLMQGEHIVLTVNRVKFDHGEHNIKAMGFLDRIATEEEKVQFYEQQHNKNEESQKYEEYTNEDN